MTAAELREAEDQTFDALRKVQQSRQVSARGGMVLGVLHPTMDRAVCAGRVSCRECC